MTTKKHMAPAPERADAPAPRGDAAGKAPALEPFDWRKHTELKHEEHRNAVAEYLSKNPDVIAFLAMVRESVARHCGPASLVLTWDGHKPGGAAVWEGLPDMWVQVVTSSSSETSWRDAVRQDVVAAQDRQPQLRDKIEVMPW